MGRKEVSEMKRWAAEPGSDLAKLRMEAHRVFDARWVFEPATRSKAYLWLARQMGLRPDDCHIGMFDEDQCRWVIEICTENPA